MKVKCIMCGKEEEINKLHKDYRKLEANPKAAFYCQGCLFKLTYEANKESDPMGMQK